MTPPKSDVWRYFTRTSKQEAKCNFCSKLLKTSGNTSNLKSHLKVHKLKDEIKSKPLVQTKADSNRPTPESVSIKSKLAKFAKGPKLAAFDTDVTVAVPFCSASTSSFRTIFFKSWQHCHLKRNRLSGKLLFLNALPDKYWN
uniref:BED-type domain-containing protein n=1 Tax=Clastoptera arizonana TaxID=38151 RepID=A0A1B6BWX9_9HEMI